MLCAESTVCHDASYSYRFEHLLQTLQVTYKVHSMFHFETDNSNANVSKFVNNLDINAIKIVACRFNFRKYLTCVMPEKKKKNTFIRNMGQSILYGLYANINIQSIIALLCCQIFLGTECII